MAGVSSETYGATMDIETSQILVDLIHRDFSRCVVPANVFWVFRLPGYKSLALEDIGAIDAKVKTDGEIAGSTMLLNRLKNYPNWFTILIRVLKHPEINQEHLAIKFEECLAKAYELRLRGTIAGNTSTYMRNDSALSVVELGNQPLANNGTQNSQPNTSDDFDIDADCSGELHSDVPRPKSTENIALLLSRPLPDPKEAATNDDETLPKQLAGINLLTDSGPMSKDQSDDGYEKAIKSCSSSSGKEVNEYDEPYSEKRGAASSAEGARQKAVQESKYENAPFKERGSVNQTPSQRQHENSKGRHIRDFSFPETIKGLGGFKGWHKKQSDKQVIQEFKEILDQNKDGHYMVWYWEKKKRPAICVSHKGKLITYVIHRRSDKASPTGFMCYIVDDIMSQSTLSDLFFYHKENGLPNMKEGPGSENIKMKHAMSP